MNEIAEASTNPEKSTSLRQETQQMLDRLFTEAPTDLAEVAHQKRIEILVRGCVLYLMADLPPAEKEALIANEHSIKTIIEQAIKRAPMADESVRTHLIEKVDSISPEDLKSNVAIARRLDLTNIESMASQFNSHLIDSFQKRPDLRVAYNSFAIQ